MKTHTYKRERLYRDWVNGTVSLCQLWARRDTLQKQLDEVQKELAVIKDALSSMPIHCDCYDCRNDPNNH